MEFNNAGYDIFSEAGVNPALCLSNRDTSEGMRRGTTRRQATGAGQHHEHCQTDQIRHRRVRSGVRSGGANDTEMLREGVLVGAAGFCTISSKRDILRNAAWVKSGDLSVCYWSLLR